MPLDLAQIFDTDLVRNDSGVWLPERSDGTGYPSDDFARGPLLGLINGARDLSSLSPELEGLAASWPARYYLSAERSTLLRAFEFDRSSTVMEIGSGCGSITRLLGETFEAVVGVEGEVHRAAVGAARSRDQDNVAVVCAPFQQLTPVEPFGVVFCVGVLEYSAMSSTADDPIHEMLTDLRSRVADDGALVLAIENKFGLKYLSGAAEDHTGVRFDGIEGYRGSGTNGPRTLGRVELEQSLRKAGFEGVDFYFPFPDYKFVRSVVSERAASTAGPQLAELISQQVATDYSSYPKSPLFNQRAAWHEAERNGLVPDLANSFLVVASPAATQSRVTAPWDIAAFNMTPRKPEYWASTRVSGLESGMAKVTRERMTQLPQRPGPVSMTESSTESWIVGESASQLASDAAMARSATTESVALALGPWIEHLRANQDASGHLPPSFLDATPGNVIVSEGETTYIDQEWSWDSPLAFESVVVRGLVMFYVRARDTGGLQGELARKSVAKLVIETAGHLGVQASRRDLDDYVEIQEQLLRQVQDYSGSRARMLRSMLLSSTTRGAVVQGQRTVDLARRAARRGRRIARRVVAR